MRYREPARSYASSLALLAALAAGFLLDLFVLGGGGAHVVAWAVGAVLVVGIDALVVHAARELRSIAVTDDELQVGEDSLPLQEILGVLPDGDADVPVLGRSAGAGMPRGTAPLTLRLTDGRAIVVATRHPEQLTAALALADTTPAVRPADPADLDLLADIDTRAESLFRVAGMQLPDIALDLDQFRTAVAVFVAGRPPVGFVQLDVVDGVAHVQEIAVLPGYMRRGIGTTLLDAACAWATREGYAAITLTTFADIAWNGPYYAARGFTELAELTPELRELRDWERDVGLDASGRRIAMRRELRGHDGHDGEDG